MTFTRFFLLVFIIISCFSHSIAKAEENYPLKTAWLGEHETFIVWYAKKYGWDKENGLSLQILNFDTGKNIINGLKAYKWEIAGIGAVPATMSVFSDKIKIIAIANNEAKSNGLFVKGNSHILEKKGYNPNYSELYGSPETIKGSTILCTKGSSAHHLLVTWLKALNLTEKDVNIQFMDITKAFGAFKNGLGDILSVWAPYSTQAINLGYKKIADGNSCKLIQPILIVANAEFAEKHPEEVKAFLKLYMQGIEMLRTVSINDIAKEYVLFYKEQVGMEITLDDAIVDLQNHSVLTLDEQKVIFTPSQDQSIIKNWLMDIINFYESINEISNEKAKIIKEFKNIDYKFIQSVK